MLWLIPVRRQSMSPPTISEGNRVYPRSLECLGLSSSVARQRLTLWRELVLRFGWSLVECSFSLYIPLAGSVSCGLGLRLKLTRSYCLVGMRVCHRSDGCLLCYETGDVYNSGGEERFGLSVVVHWWFFGVLLMSTLEAGAVASSISVAGNLIRMQRGGNNN